MVPPRARSSALHFLEHTGSFIRTPDGFGDTEAHVNFKELFFFRLLCCMGIGCNTWQNQKSLTCGHLQK